MLLWCAGITTPSLSFQAHERNFTHYDMCRFSAAKLRWVNGIKTQLATVSKQLRFGRYPRTPSSQDGSGEENIMSSKPSKASAWWSGFGRDRVHRTERRGSSWILNKKDSMSRVKKVKTTYKGWGEGWTLDTAVHNKSQEKNVRNSTHLQNDVLSFVYMKDRYIHLEGTL